MRMLYRPEDAEDATQAIILKIITHLCQFKSESAFMTWAYRIAVNHLLATKKRDFEHRAESFDDYEAKLNRDCAKEWQELKSEAHQSLAVEEVRISCLQGLLLSLNRGHRLAFILVHILDLSNKQGAQVLGITHAAFRKRLSRARVRLCNFMIKNCRLIDPTNRCQCERIAARDVNNGKLRFDRLMFADHPCRVKHQEIVWDNLQELDQLKRIGAVYKLNTDFQPPDSILKNIKQIISTRQYNLL